MSTNITQQNYSVTRELRNKLNQHSSMVLWFTGLSGSGKSTIAEAVEQALFEMKFRTYTLDGDNLRGGINSGLGFTESDRNENLRRTAEIAKLFVDAGMITVAAFVSPLEKDRKMVKEIIGENDFVEIFVDTTLEECERRDVKGLYQKARQGLIPNFTGIDSPYESPKHPDIWIKTDNESITVAVEKVITFVTQKIETFRNE
ncbi:adenylyl-sulfate kinase [Flavobacterium sp. XGLA_31]|uniref:adenylyl-sulfate kinase n=1 Tax=Flavobacterium sp. XGLA_31 TaxID=3447666 RepID=UPI003F363D67